jgi:hypothetical protein
VRLISRIEIRGFRSIRHCAVDGLDDFTALAGLNNSGKSNVLRALNAFFTGETDERTPLDVAADYHRPDLRLKKAKEITVSVSFVLPDKFRFRKRLENVESLLGGREFEITKKWRVALPIATYSLNGRDLTPEETLRIDQFLQLVSFRYIPNRVMPVDVLRSQREALRDVLVRRLGPKAKQHEAAFDIIRDTSESLIQGLSDDLSTASPDIGSVHLATPSSWTDVAFALGYRVVEGDVELEDALQGSGVQSLLMLETLHLIDRDYFQQFGWRQAAIWALEEPESSLHASLEARVASYLATISTEPSSRLQVVCTSHSDLVVQHAGQAVLVHREDGHTECQSPSSPRDALEQLARAGVSRWSHPLLYYPLDPIVLVEGKYDAAFLEEAFRYYRPRRPVHVTYLEMLDDDKSGGKDDTIRYLKAHAKAIKTRRPDAPVIVVLDWDAAGQVAGLLKRFDPNDPIRVLAWPNSSFNPLLNDTFRGIERSFSNRVVKEAEARGAVIYRSRSGECSVERSSYEKKAKPLLAQIVKEGLLKADFRHSAAFVKKILTEAQAN